MKAEEIKELWHKLTDFTYPYSMEDEVVDIIEDYIPVNLKKDEYGNYFTKIGNSRSLFACHLDVVARQKLKINKITYEKDGREYVKTDGFTLLGADDKTGVVILLNMIDNKVPGTYYFFIGEEVGYVGSGLLYRQNEFLSNFDRAISFDRKGHGSIINRQKGEWCCSDAFVKGLSAEFKKNGMKFKADKFGMGTDAALFMGVIPECTNLSVGYFNEHTYSEEQDMDYMVQLANAATKINWEKLPVSRVPKSFDTEDPEEIEKETDLPEYKLFHTFNDVRGILHNKLRSSCMNANFFKPNKEMKFAQMKDYKGENNFSLFINSDGSIDIKIGETKLPFDSMEDFKKRIDDYIKVPEPEPEVKTEKLITKFSKYKKS